MPKDNSSSRTLHEDNSRSNNIPLETTTPLYRTIWRVSGLSTHRCQKSLGGATTKLPKCPTSRETRSSQATPHCGHASNSPPRKPIPCHLSQKTRSRQHVNLTTASRWTHGQRPSPRSCILLHPGPMPHCRRTTEPRNVS